MPLPHPPEFRQRAVDLAREGAKPVAKLAKDLGISESWWDEASLLNLLHGSVTPGRLAYFRDVLTRRLGTRLAGLRVLDIGCGGGFLGEEFAALGCPVTGIVPWPASVGAARAHGRE